MIQIVPKRSTHGKETQNFVPVFKGSAMMLRQLMGHGELVQERDRKENAVNNDLLEASIGTKQPAGGYSERMGDEGMA